MRCVPHIILDFDPYLPWFRRVLAGVEAYAARCGGWQFLFLRMLSRQALGRLPKEWKGVGLISQGPQPWALERGLPQVCIDRPGQAVPCPCLTTRFAGVGRLAAGHLVEAGYRHLAVLGLAPQASGADRERDEGFTGEAERLGIPVHRLQISGWDAERLLAVSPEVLRAWEKMVKDLPKPLGVFARNLRELYPLHFLLRELGLEIPAEAGLIVGGEDEQLLDALRPSVTAIDRNDWGIGYRAGELLRAVMEGRKTPDITFVDPAGVIPRDSTRLCRGRDPLVEEVMAAMRAGLARPVSLPELARSYGMSSKTLERRFRSDMYQTPGRVLMRMRMDRAKELLRDGRLSSSEISEACGYQESSALSRAFRKETGMSPRDWRKRSQSRPALPGPAGPAEAVSPGRSR